MMIDRRRSASLVVLTIVAPLLAGCISTARTSMPKDESHYARSLPHHLAASLAFARVGQALDEAYDDQPKALLSQDPAQGSFLLEPIVSYKKGGAMGEVQRARYHLQVVVDATSVELQFDLGPDVSGGGWAPKSELPYIYRSFDDVVSVVEEALASP